MSRDVSEVIDLKKGGWSIGLNSGGYLTRVYHYYADGHRTSVCYAGFRRARAPQPNHKVPEDKRCAGCRRVLTDHEDTGTIRKNRSA